MDLNCSKLSTELVVYNLFKAKMYLRDHPNEHNQEQVDTYTKELNNRGYGEQGIKDLTKARFNYERFNHCKPQELFNW
jgi:hypothetical protein